MWLLLPVPFKKKRKRPAWKVDTGVCVLKSVCICQSECKGENGIALDYSWWVYLRKVRKIWEKSKTCVAPGDDRSDVAARQRRTRTEKKSKTDGRRHEISPAHEAENESRQNKNMKRTFRRLLRLCWCRPSMRLGDWTCPQVLICQKESVWQQWNLSPRGSPEVSIWSCCTTDGANDRFEGQKIGKWMTDWIDGKISATHRAVRKHLVFHVPGRCLVILLFVINFTGKEKIPCKNFPSLVKSEPGTSPKAWSTGVHPVLPPLLDGGVSSCRTYPHPAGLEANKLTWHSAFWLLPRLLPGILYLITPSWWLICVRLLLRLVRSSWQACTWTTCFVFDRSSSWGLICV